MRKKKNNDGKCAPRKVSRRIANERKRAATRLFTEESNDKKCTYDEKRERDLAEILRKLDLACRCLFRDYRVPWYYTPEDLASEVKVNFMECLPEYRGDVKLEDFLYRIARNQLISVCRRKERDRFVESERNEESDALDEGDFTARLKRGYRETSRNLVADQADQAILFKELTSPLSNAARSLCEQLDGDTPTDIAEELGVSRQAVSQRRDRIYDQMRMILEEGDSRIEAEEACRTLGSQTATAKALTRMRAIA
jgi:RNA polymerase sigma factor (sigma-70 family)